MLVNLLESNDTKCRLGALHILSQLAVNTEVRKTVVDLDGIPLLVGILSEPSINLKIMAAETISYVGRVRIARKLVRKCGGIPKLIDLLDIKME